MQTVLKRAATAAALWLATLATGHAGVVAKVDLGSQEMQVYVDGNLAGTVRDYNGNKERLFVLPGQHNIEFRAPGYVPYTEHVKLIPDQDLRLRARMVKLPKP